MSRTTLSSAALKAMYAEETGDFPIMLITITDPTLSVPVRVSSDATSRLIVTDQEVIYGTTSRGNDFYYIPFTISLPTDLHDSAPTTSITLDNVGRDLIAVIRALKSPPAVNLEIVMASSLNTVEVTYPNFDLTQIDYDMMTITGALTIDILVTEPSPPYNFNPSQFPGMF